MDAAGRATLKVSIIIPTFGRPDMVAAAARSAARQKLPRGGTSLEVLVVDDGGRDDTAAALRGIRGVKYARKEHGGPASARNFGARLAKGSILAFLDSDTQAEPGWLAAGVTRLGVEPGLFGVEGRVLPLGPGAATPFEEGVENLQGGRWLTCNLFVRRKEFLALGGFDERFKRPVREDSEFAFRAQDSGHSFAFEPKARVLHPVRKTGLGRYFFHAREGMYEALIERNHPRAYRQHFKWTDGRALPVYFLPQLAALPLAALNGKLAFFSLALGGGVTLYAWCRRKRWSALDLVRLLPAALLASYVRMAYVAWGYWRFPLSPED